MSYYRVYHYSFGVQYKHVYFKGGRPSGNVGGVKGEKSTDSTRLEESLCRSRRLLRDYVLCNPWDYFCTFTFDSSKIDRYDYKACSAALRKFFNNYKRRSASFRYLVIPELHKDSAIHFHGFIKGVLPDDLFVPDKILKRVKGELKEVKNTKKYVRWKNYHFGNFDCSIIKDISAAANYVCKYITKDLAALPAGQKVILHSLGLNKPELIFDEDDVSCFPDRPDFVGDYCVMKYSDSLYGLLPDYWNETCSDVRFPDIDLDDSVFVPLIGEQLHL